MLTGWDGVKGDLLVEVDLSVRPCAALVAAVPAEPDVFAVLVQAERFAGVCEGIHGGVRGGVCCGHVGVGSPRKTGTGRCGRGVEGSAHGCHGVEETHRGEECWEGGP